MAIKSFTRSTIENNIFYRSMLAGNTAYEPSSEDILAEEILTSSQASVTFSSLDTLAAGYQHLQLRVTSRTDKADVGDWLRVQFNGDSTGANYDSHTLWGDGSAVYSARYAGSSGGADGGLLYAATLSANATANAFSAMVMDILDPFETSKYTTLRAFYGQHGNYNRIALTSSLWMNTAALTSLTLLSDTSPNFVSGCSFTLIGVK